MLVRWLLSMVPVPHSTMGYSSRSERVLRCMRPASGSARQEVVGVYMASTRRKPAGPFGRRLPAVDHRDESLPLHLAQRGLGCLRRGRVDPGDAFQREHGTFKELVELAISHGQPLNPPGSASAWHWALRPRVLGGQPG